MFLEEKSNARLNIREGITVNSKRKIMCDDQFDTCKYHLLIK